MKLSIVIPVYKSQDILTELVHQIRSAVELEGEGLAAHFELILVNDCSPDNSWNLILQLAQTHSFIRGISLRKNFGQHSAIMAGLHHARGEVVIIMDDDLQHPPSEIPSLMAAVNGGADVCYTRYIGRQHALWKKLGSRFNDWVATALLDKPTGLYLSSFKALSRDQVKEVIKYDGPYPYLDGLILETTRAIEVLNIRHQRRHTGIGNYNMRRSISLWLRMATSFSVFPLRLATILGFLLALISFILIVAVVLQKLLDPSIAVGWTSLMAAVLFVGGVQTLSIGLLGEYLGRAYMRLNGKPQFIVRETSWIEK